MTVGWDADSDVAAWPGLPPLDGDRAADACVVGLGASGLAAVEELTARGLSVVGIDAGRVGGGAAGRNGGFLLGGPAAFLHDAIARWGEADAVSLYRQTLAEIDVLVDTLGTDVVRRTGSIRLAGLPGEPTSAVEAAVREHELDDCAAHALALRTHGIAVEEYDGLLGRGIFLPDDAAMHPARRALAVAVRAARVAELHEHTSVRELADGRVVTAHGQITAGLVVVAVDGRLDILLPQLADRVRTARLQMLATAPLGARRLHCPLYGRWGYDYAQQTPDGRLFVGGGRDLFTAQEWTTLTETTPPVQRYLDAIAPRIAGAPVQVTHRWAASVGFTLDGRPLCTKVDERTVAIGGYNGTGNLVGPIAARAAVALAIDGTAPPGYFVG
ncbi:MAG TPA: FAD-dependent oxidoreductase [Jatrophihabitantaceae bacterium]|nr:FAD-dependent oxidoreductase [Jatrophihabitantaceae bacterium]